MSLFFKRRAWYSDGLAFECTRCGQCCAGPNEGYVWISSQEVQALADFLSLSVEKVYQLYLRNIEGQLSLLESPASKDCIFLDRDDQGLSLCRVYPVRPRQCRNWPFWPANLRSSSTWCLAGTRCPGINRGVVHEFQAIQQKKHLTDP